MQVITIKGFSSNNERARYLFHWSQSNPEESFPRVEHDLWNPENSCSLNSWTSSLGTTSTPAFGGMEAIVVHVASRAGINFSAWRLHTQLTFRESLRDIETCLRAVEPKLYHAGF